MKKAICILMSMPILIGALTACNQPKSLSPEEAKTIAKEAYLYGFPMVVNYKTMNAFTLDKSNPKYKGPFNFLACEARLLTPEDKTIVSPNSNTPVCYMWGDLRKEPVVITVPGLERGNTGRGRQGHSLQNPTVLYRCEDPAIRSGRPDKGKRNSGCI